MNEEEKKHRRPPQQEHSSSDGSRRRIESNDDVGRDMDGRKKKSPFEHLHDGGGRFVGGGRGVITGAVSGGFRGVVHDLPYHSLMVFLATFMVATAAGLLVIPLGIAVSGSVWTVMVSIGFIAIILVVTCVVSLANFVRGLVAALTTNLMTQGREGGGGATLVGALFRGYFGAILQVGCIILIFNALLVGAAGLFVIPMVYFIPIDVWGFTVPIPIPLGYTGRYIVLAVYVVAAAVLIVSCLMGGVELLQVMRNQVWEEGDAGEGSSSPLQRAVLYLLFLTLFPALNILFCSFLIQAYSQVISNEILAFGWIFGG